MRLSCNFVNVYTIVYHVWAYTTVHVLQYTFTRVHARIPNGYPREQSTKVSPTSRRASAAAWRARSGRPTIDFRARILARRGSSRGSRQGCPCQCRFHGIPALQNIMLSVNPMLFLLCLPIAWLVAIFWVCQNHIPCAKQWKVMFISKFYANS